MKLLEIANYVEKYLLLKNFIIHRYDSYSTESIYIKLDYGACNSIRISDHIGYEHLSYKYEINKRFTKSGWRRDSKGFWRYECKATAQDINNLLKMICNDRCYKRSFYDYEQLIENHKKESKCSNGFWKKCKEVKLDV